MPQFIIDANLPHYLKIWGDDKFIHVFDLNKDCSDSEIWNYPKENGLTIISKDSDFANRIRLVSPPPKVIHFKTGNMLIEDFEDFLSNNWVSISELSSCNKLVKVFRTYLEANE